MKTEKFVNGKFSYLDDFVRQLPDNFQNMGESIYVGRNDVRVINVNGLQFAVKFYKRMTLANRYIYAMIRKTKAQRAFEHTELLLKKGITSPENVAYINRYRRGMLEKAFYISVFTDYKPLKELIPLPISDTEGAFKAFSRFTYRLHCLGIYHKDFTIFNVLYSFDGANYDFSLIDNNRMTFGKYSYRKGMKNLKRLSVPVGVLGLIAAEYSRVAHENELKTLNILAFSRWHHLAHHNFKRWIKTPLRWITGKHEEMPINIKMKSSPID